MIIKSVVIPLLMFIVMNYFSEKIKGGRLWGVCSSYSFGIYLYAEPLNYWLLYEFEKHMGLSYFGTEFGSLVIYFSRLFLTSAIAVVITWLFKKINVKFLY